MAKTYEEINEKIRHGKAVVCTAEEIIDLVRKKGAEKTAEEVDVITTGTFGAMCSSGAFLNFGHSSPPIRMTNILLNDVQAYGGLAAVDTYIGATQMTEDPQKGYGGAHVIEDLIAGKKIHLRAWGPGTDCYVRKDVDTYITLDDLNEAYLFNPRNSYQNYGIATNTSGRTIYTYMGKLLPKMKNATYSSAGQLSPLLNDPHCDVIGIGTRIFLAGGEGYVSWQGTQFKTDVEEVNGVPVGGARTLAVIGDMKQMDPRYVRGLDLTGYGISLALGIGVPLPVLNEDVVRRASISDDEIFAEMFDYSLPSGRAPMARYSYSELRSGKIEYNGKTVRTSSMSSYAGAKKVAAELKDRIERGEFSLAEPGMMLPRESRVKPMKMQGARACTGK
ncbi:MAG: homocysteine biosynthesis protein [Candidatus Methanomethylophilaceae archaeon]|nr:homocysteine biosynthesis protein [Candidatus Methanomethylophilaceae archaeon]